MQICDRCDRKSLKVVITVFAKCWGQDYQLSNKQKDLCDQCIDDLAKVVDKFLTEKKDVVVAKENK